MKTTTTQLHAALIWGGEPIANVLHDKPGPVTIGPVGGATFTVPDLGLPEVFSIMTPGERGYVLTMGNAMGGTVSIGGVTRRVTDLVGDAPFAATAVAPGDWGVVDLDGAGLQLFFQVAPAVEKLAPTRFELDSLLPAAAFSVLLHLFLLIATFVTSTGESPFTWPGSRSLTGAYLVTRIEPLPPAPPPPELPAVAPPKPDEPSPPDDTHIKPPKKADKDDSGKPGDTGRPDAHDDARDDAEPEADVPEVGFQTRENRELLERLTNSKVDPSKWLKQGHGRGKRGTGPGIDGDELPGNRKGDVDGVEHKKQGDLDTETGAHGDGDGDGDCVVDKRGVKKCGKGKRHGDGDGDGDGDGHGPKEVPVDRVGPPTISSGTDLDPREIERRIMARKGLFRTCYQQEFNRNSSLGGTITPRFTIAKDGSVTQVTIESSTVNNKSVESCVQRQLRALRFPSSSTGGVVRYPLAFNGGGR